jgi:microtubule-associated protein-like 6
VFYRALALLVVVPETRGHFQRHISHVCFDHSGDRIVGIGANEVSTSVCVFQWRSATLLFASNIEGFRPLDCCFNHRDTLAVCGDAAVYFWSKDSEGYSKRRGNFGPLVQGQALTCVTEHHRSHAAYIVTGTVTGLLLVWQDRNCIQHLKAHHGTVNVIITVPFGFITGGKDKRIRLWTPKLEAKAIFDLSLFGSNASIRSLDLSKDGSGILTGTRGGEIYEVRDFQHNTGNFRKPCCD